MNTKEFFDYLIYIGLLLPDKIEELKKRVKNELKFDNDKKIFMQNLIVDYLLSLNKKNLTKLGVNIYNQYINNKFMTISKHLLRVFNIIQKLYFKKIKFVFYFLKKISKYNKNKSTTNLNQKKYIPTNRSRCSLYNNSQRKLYNKFFERMEQYSNKKDQNKILQLSQLEQDINYICTFSPDLSLTNNKKFQSMEKYVKTKEKNITNNINTIKEEPKRKIDKNRIKKLSEDYIEQKKKNELLKEKIDKENGFTFSPKLNIKSKYNKNIKDNFLERNKNLLNNKNDFIKGFNLLRELEMKGFDIDGFNINS